MSDLYTDDEWFAAREFILGAEELGHLDPRSRRRDRAHRNLQLDGRPAVIGNANVWATLLLGSDRQWQETTGSCGGCANPDCHPGKVCGDVPGREGGVCDLCPNRADEIELHRTP